MLKGVGLKGRPGESLEAILWLLVPPPRGFMAQLVTCQERKGLGVGVGGGGSKPLDQ